MRIVDRMSPALRWAVLALAALVILTTIGVVVISRSPRGADAHPDALAGPSGTASSAGPSGTAPSTGAQQSATSDPGPSPTPSAGGRPSPSLSAAPARSTAPAQLGGRGGWPNADNTGVPTGHRLTSSGAIRVTKPGTVIDGLDLHGDISVEADNVTIRNCRIVTAGTWGIIQRQNAAGLIVRDSDIRGNGKDQLQHAIFTSVE